MRLIFQGVKTCNILRSCFRVKRLCRISNKDFTTTIIHRHGNSSVETIQNETPVNVFIKFGFPFYMTSYKQIASFPHLASFSFSSLQLTPHSSIVQHTASSACSILSSRAEDKTVAEFQRYHVEICFSPIPDVSILLPNPYRYDKI